MTVWPDDGTSTPRTTVQLISVRTIVNPDTAAALKITQQGATSNSTSVGGALNVDNSLNPGAGLVVFSSQAAPTGRLIVGRSSSPTFSQTVGFFQQAGTGHALHADLIQTNSATASALNVTSANAANSAMFLSGVETGRGTLKITHTGPGTNADANASGLSIDLQGANTACQGIHIDSVAQGTTGALLDIRNNGNQLLKVLSDPSTFAIPRVVLGSGGPTITICVGIPTASEVNGSIALRSDGTGPNLYVRENGAWVAK